MNARQQLEVLTRNCVEVISPDALLSKIETSLSDKKPLCVKAGFDPSAPDIHLGHTVLLAKLRQFQDLGHRVVFIIGDATARVGDPSGRTQTRPILTEKEIQANSRTYQEQAFKILDRRRTQVVYNSSWFDGFKFRSILALLARVTVRQIIDRDDFQKRLAEGTPISMMELFYPLMQAYDSVQTRADVELGGSDQKFNLLLGRELQRESGLTPQAVMTLPLLVGLDGEHKMSKSLANHIGVTDPPNDMFGKIMSLPDKAMPSYYDLLTDKQSVVVEEEIRSGRLHPKAAKEALASEITARFWGAIRTQAARDEFNKVFSRRENPSDTPCYEFPAGDYRIARLIVDCKLASSLGEARRLVTQSAVSVDGGAFTDMNGTLAVTGAEKLIRVGKRRFARVRAKGVRREA